MRIKDSTFLKVLMVLLLFLWASPILYAQDAAQFNAESLTRGKLWETFWNSFQIGQPVDPPSQFYTISYPGHTVGADQFDHPSYAEGAGPIIYGERDGVAKAYTLTTRFYASAQFAFALENSELTQNFNMADPGLLAEEILTGGHHVKELQLNLFHKSMVWSYPKYDDFVIHEVTIENPDTAGAITDVYFGFRYGMWSQRGAVSGAGGWGDEKYGWDAEDGGANDGFFYIYDDWAFDWEDESPIQFNFGPGPERGDIGDAADLDPEVRSTELLSPAYFAAICLDPAGTEINQNILQYFGQGEPSPGCPLEDQMVRMLADPPSKFKDVLTHQQPRMSWDEARAAGGEGGNKYERDRTEVVVSCGPFDLASGESVTIVFAEVMGEMDRAKIVEGGVANIDLMPTECLAALQENVTNCRAMYAAGYDVEDPPPTPTNGEGSLTISAVGGGVQIAWPPIAGSYQDPDLGTNDLAGYRVYRSNFFATGPWLEIADIAVGSETMEDGMVVYVDEGLPLGVGNYYAVTSYDDDGNESGKVNPNRFPDYPLRAVNQEFPNKVYVVPNPFRQNSGLFGTDEELRMEFIGLPAKCTIRIYTLAGELVREIEHDDGSGSEAWGSISQLDYQTNKWAQYVAPGFYIFHVEADDGESFIGKFAIIR